MIDALDALQELNATTASGLICGLACKEERGIRQKAIEVLANLGDPDDSSIQDGLRKLVAEAETEDSALAQAAL